jgi:hypothetical protein
VASVSGAVADLTEATIALEAGIAKLKNHMTLKTDSFWAKLGEGELAASAAALRRARVTKFEVKIFAKWKEVQEDSERKGVANELIEKIGKKIGKVTIDLSTCHPTLWAEVQRVVSGAQPQAAPPAKEGHGEVKKLSTAGVASSAASGMSTASKTKKQRRG